MDSSTLSHSRSRWMIVVIYAGFLLTGALTVLPGTLLPRVTALYRLTDRQAGTMLLVQFASSACGALLVRRRFEATLVRGYGLICAAAILLMTPQALPAIAGVGFFGLGLGMAMTSTSMLVGRLYPRSRGAALSTLNSCWSLGAMLCPLAIAVGAERWSVRGLCLSILLLSAFFSLVPLGASFPEDDRAQDRSRVWNSKFLATLAGFALLAFLYVGVETGVGSWMSTYASRVVAWDFARSSFATATFWGALLVSRVVAPLLLRRLSEVRCLLLMVAAAAAGLAILIAAREAWILLMGAAWIGFALGPIFPLTIALTIERIGGTGNAGWVFALAGFGGGVLPWITGIISSGTHSLREGLLVLLIANVLMLLTALRLLAPGRPSVLHAASADV